MAKIVSVEWHALQILNGKIKLPRTTSHYKRSVFTILKELEDYGVVLRAIDAILWL
jgi:hypothetical protein